MMRRRASERMNGSVMKSYRVCDFQSNLSTLQKITFQRCALAVVRPCLVQGVAWVKCRQGENTLRLHHTHGADYRWCRSTDIVRPVDGLFCHVFSGCWLRSQSQYQESCDQLMRLIERGFAYREPLSVFRCERLDGQVKPS
jgi:hypothetical protein